VLLNIPFLGIPYLLSTFFGSLRRPASRQAPPDTRIQSTERTRTQPEIDTRIQRQEDGLP